jgi:D-hexose-6-phosphate mutarotase
MHVNVQPNKETAHEIAGENQGVKSLCMLMDEEIKETIKIGNHYMDGLFAWEPGGRKGMCFFPWKSGWISMLTVAALHEILC